MCATSHLAKPLLRPHEFGMTNTGKAAAAIAGAVGSAAIAAALLYANKRKEKKEAAKPAPIPSGEAPETD